MYYSDLGAKVYVDAVPDGLTDELPRLYNSLFSTEAWFRIYDRERATGACLLEDPRHVLLFCQKGDTVEVLNKAFEIAAADARRACKALFRALPSARRIHLEVLFPPGQLRLPRRILYWADDRVVHLPTTVVEYGVSLGKRTRKNLRNYENRLRREFPDVAVKVFTVGERSHELVETFLGWHLLRCRRAGVTSVYESRPEQRDQLAALLHETGEAQTTTIAGRLAAIEFIVYVGDQATVYAGSFDERYRGLHLGFLSSYWVICETIARGARRCHLLWSTDYYKSLLGAIPVRATRLSVFRSHYARLYSPREAVEVAGRRLQRTKGYYFRARHSAGRVLRAGKTMFHSRPPA